MRDKKSPCAKLSSITSQCLIVLVLFFFCFGGGLVVFFIRFFSLILFWILFFSFSFFFFPLNFNNEVAIYTQFLINKKINVTVCFNGWNGTMNFKLENPFRN